MMAAESEQEIPREPTPLTLKELLHHYLAMANSLYDAKAKGNTEQALMMESILNALRADLMKAAADGGFEKDLKDVFWNEQGSAKRTLWIRMTANRLKYAKPGLLSLELLGSAGVVVAIAYYIVHTDTLTALSAGVVIIGLRLCLPRIMDAVATREERKLRKFYSSL